MAATRRLQGGSGSTHRSPSIGGSVAAGRSAPGGGNYEAARLAAQQVRTAIDQLGLGAAASREIARLDIIDGRLQLKTDLAAATVFLRRALSERLKMLDPKSPLMAEAMIYLAAARRAAGDTAEASSCCKPRAKCSVHTPEWLRSSLPCCARRVLQGTYQGPVDRRSTASRSTVAGVAYLFLRAMSSFLNPLRSPR